MLLPVQDFGLLLGSHYPPTPIDPTVPIAQHIALGHLLKYFIMGFNLNAKTKCTYFCGTRIIVYYSISLYEMCCIFTSSSSESIPIPYRGRRWGITWGGVWAGHAGWYVHADMHTHSADTFICHLPTHWSPCNENIMLIITYNTTWFYQKAGMTCFRLQVYIGSQRFPHCLHVTGYAIH